MYKITRGLSSNSKTVAISCVKEMSAGGDAFVIGNVGVEKRNVQSKKKSVWGSCSSCSSLLTKCVVSYINDCVVCTRSLRW